MITVPAGSRALLVSWAIQPRSISANTTAHVAPPRSMAGYESVSTGLPVAGSGWYPLAVDSRVANARWKNG